MSTETSREQRAGLLRHDGFRRLIGAVTLSQLGTSISMVAIPLIAVSQLNASAFEVGVLVAAETIAFLLIGLPAGAWVDRSRRKRLLVVSDLVRFGLLASIPLAALFDVLTLVQLYVVAVGVGVFSVFFDTAYVAYMPFLVGKERMTAGFATVDVTFKAAKTAGPAIGGALARIAGAPVAVLVDAVTYLLSAAFLSRIPQREAPPEPEPDSRLLAEIKDGIGFVFRHPGLRLLTITGGMTGLVESALAAVQPFFLLRELAVGPVGYGVVVAVGTAGAIVGPLFAPALIERYGHSLVLRAVPLLTAPFAVLLPLAGRGWMLSIYAAGLAIVFFGGAVYNIAQVGLRQYFCTDRLRGRMNATIRFVIWGSMPIGALIGGALAGLVGTRAALWACAVGFVLTYLPMLAAPIRKVRDSELPEL